VALLHFQVDQLWETKKLKDSLAYSNDSDLSGVENLLRLMPEGTAIIQEITSEVFQLHFAEYNILIA